MSARPMESPVPSGGAISGMDNRYFWQKVMQTFGSSIMASKYGYEAAQEYNKDFAGNVVQGAKARQARIQKDIQARSEMERAVQMESETAVPAIPAQESQVAISAGAAPVTADTAPATPTANGAAPATAIEPEAFGDNLPREAVAQAPTDVTETAVPSEASAEAPANAEEEKKPETKPGGITEYKSINAAGNSKNFIDLEKALMNEAVWTDGDAVADVKAKVGLLRQQYFLEHATKAQMAMAQGDRKGAAASMSRAMDAVGSGRNYVLTATPTGLIMRAEDRNGNSVPLAFVDQESKTAGLTEQSIGALVKQYQDPAKWGYGTLESFLAQQKLEIEEAKFDEQKRASGVAEEQAETRIGLESERIDVARAEAGATAAYRAEKLGIDRTTAESNAEYREESIKLQRKEARAKTKIAKIKVRKEQKKLQRASADKHGDFILNKSFKMITTEEMQDTGAGYSEPVDVRRPEFAAGTPKWRKAYVSRGWQNEVIALMKRKMQKNFNLSPEQAEQEAASEIAEAKLAQ